MAFYIAGAGGFGRECLDAAMACGIAVDAFLDDRRATETVRGLPVLAPGSVDDGTYLAGIAKVDDRRRMVERLERQGLRATTIIHPRAVIGPETEIGEGSVVLANAHVSSSVVLGRHVQINYNATVGHDAVLDDYATVYPGSNVSGAVHLEGGVTMGSNSCVLQGLTVGHDTVVGAGAVVVGDVPAEQVVKGVPAR